MAPDQIEREVLLPASPAEVWKALTDGGQVSEWFGAKVEMEPKRGGRVRFRFPDGSERSAVIETFESSTCCFCDGCHSSKMPKERPRVARAQTYDSL
jgi:activator of Hsp90 ATPase-like protein